MADNINQLNITLPSSGSWENFVSELNSNFSKIANSYVYKGDRSTMSIKYISLFKDGVTEYIYDDLIDEGKKLADAIFVDSSLATANKLSYFKTVTVPWWCEEGTSVRIFPAGPITYFDPDFSEGNANTDTIDYTCLCVAKKDDEDNFVFDKTSIYPTFYYDTTKKEGRGAWCWKINGVETGIVASAANETGEHSGKLFLLKEFSNSTIIYYNGSNWVEEKDLGESYKPLNNDLGYLITTEDVTVGGSTQKVTVLSLAICKVTYNEGTKTTSWSQCLDGKVTYDANYTKYIWDAISSGTFGKYEAAGEHGLDLKNGIWIDSNTRGDLDFYSSDSTRLRTAKFTGFGSVGFPGNISISSATGLDLDEENKVFCNNLNLHIDECTLCKNLQIQEYQTKGFIGLDPQVIEWKSEGIVEISSHLVFIQHSTTGEGTHTLYLPENPPRGTHIRIFRIAKDYEYGNQKTIDFIKNNIICIDSKIPIYVNQPWKNYSKNQEIFRTVIGKDDIDMNWSRIYFGLRDKYKIITKDNTTYPYSFNWYLPKQPVFYSAASGDRWFVEGYTSTLDIYSFKDNNYNSYWYIISDCVGISDNLNKNQVV